jgi:hypothetical protein
MHHADLGDFGRALLKAPTLHKLLSEFRRLTPTQTTNVCIDLHTQPGGQLAFPHRSRGSRPNRASGRTACTCCRGC